MITGAAQGIGFELASRLFKSGASVWITDINSVGAENARISIGADDNNRIGSSWIDVSDELSVRNAVAKCIDTLGKIDILINNAGVVGWGKVEELDLKLWKEVLDINLTGSFLCSQAVIPIMKETGKGVIVNVSSVSVRVPGVGLSAYCCSKAANEMLTKILAAEVAPYGIRVNAYAPGVTKTAMTQALIDERGGEKLNQIALRRFGEVDDIAELVLFLCSDRSSWITGAVINIDGGTMVVGRPWEAWPENERT